VITYNLATGQRAMTSRRPGTLAWAGDRLVTSGLPTQSRKQTLCLLKPDHVTCERTLAQDPSRDLTDPAVSPDGSQLALASCAQPDRKSCSLAVYAMANSAKVRDLTAGLDDTSPAWSPDGTSIVFTRAGDLFLVAADGGPGAERLLVRGGRNPTWGGTSSSSDSPVEPTLPTPEPMLPPPAEPVPATPADDPVQFALASAAEQLQVRPEQLVVVRVEQTDWSDASLGCPEPDRAYAQVIVPGYLVVLATADGATELQVHTDQGQRAVIC
jgi:dipeptidyl aminopeptidase/acylaminoacyl peptidase